MSNDEVPKPSIQSPRIGIVGTLLAHAFALFLVLMTMVKLVPPYTVFFEQEGVALPVITQRLIVLSDYCVNFWFIMYFVGMVIDAVVVIGLATAKRRRLLSAYSHLCLLAATAVLFYVSAWLLHPVYSLVR